MILLVTAGELVFFLPFVLPRVFRPTLLRTYDLTNLELGTAFSIYGVVALCAYLFGGPLADRVPARNLISLSLITTGIGGFVMALEPNLLGVWILYGYWGFTTIFLMWAAMIKATRAWGGRGYQGRAFGLLEGGRGATAAVVSGISVTIFFFLTLQQDGVDDAPMGTVYVVASSLVMMMGACVYLFMPRRIGSEESVDSLRWSRVSELLKNRMVWLQALIIVCAYTGYKMTDDFSLYAKEVLAFSEVQAAWLGTAALVLRPASAVAAGFAADRWGGFRTMVTCFGGMGVGAVALAWGLVDGWVFAALCSLAFSAMGIYGLRGVYFALMNRTNIPMVYTGTAVGLMSLIGYTPDVLASPLMGYLLDHYPGSQGHHLVFGVVGLVAIVGGLSVWGLKRTAIGKEAA